MLHARTLGWAVGNNVAFKAIWNPHLTRRSGKEGVEVWGFLRVDKLDKNGKMLVRVVESWLLAAAGKYSGFEGVF